MPAVVLKLSVHSCRKSHSMINPPTKLLLFAITLVAVALLRASGVPATAQSLQYGLSEATSQSPRTAAQMIAGQPRRVLAGQTTAGQRRRVRAGQTTAGQPRRVLA